MPMPFRQPTPVGQRFGAWVVLGDAPDRRRRPRWRCRCDCGVEADVSASDLRTGKSQRCIACRNKLAAPKPRTHGEAGRRRSPEYRTWLGMQTRCFNAKDPGYADYGARGITVCDEWRGPDGFRRFLAHVGRKPSPQHTIERIKNDRSYEPGNVRWATTTEQNRNKRGVVRITARGETKTLAEWARELGIPKGTAIGRLARGWPASRIIGLADARIEIADGRVTVS